ncbi:hypothetical protein [Brumimicrobium aurantiacum]|uniref:Uncharacterized protein n=1 Tax=Brumimicrobium aurantiacum TaxID=1737063 RepID=A0A3E1F1G6_9FLAO|nr:hypothetical protein [Brumimicrobium aurantiacum]RFC55650.1 hypothetical protein DXU93_01580 [Brumimicrobium aurantiacum]
MTGIYIAFKIEQAHIRSAIKHEIKEGIPENELHEFNLTPTEYEQLDWIRPDIEFRKHKQMFDIVRRENKGDDIVLHCVNDKEETLLFANLEELIQNKMNKESKTPKSPLNKMIKVIKVVYVNDFTNYVFQHLSLNAENGFFETKKLYQSPNLGVPTPPPDFV